MGVRVCYSTREQVQPCSSALTMKRMTVLLVLLFPALAFVTVGLFTQADRALLSLSRELNYEVHAIRFGSRSRLTRVTVPAGAETHNELASWICGEPKFNNVDGEGDITEEELTQRQHSKSVRARQLHALVSDGKCNTVATTFRLAVSRQMGPSDDPARLPGRPIKLFIVCANRGLRKVKKVGVRVLHWRHQERLLQTSTSSHLKTFADEEN